jgi:hypothetical protein
MPMGERVTAWRRNLVNLGLGVVSLAVAVAAVEVVLRMWFPIPYSVEVEYIDDGHVGWRLKPN